MKRGGNEEGHEEGERRWEKDENKKKGERERERERIDNKEVTKTIETCKVEVGRMKSRR